MVTDEAAQGMDPALTGPVDYLSCTDVCGTPNGVI